MNHLQPTSLTRVMHFSDFFPQLRRLPGRAGRRTAVPRPGQVPLRREPPRVRQHGDQHRPHVQEPGPDGGGRRVVRVRAAGLQGQRGRAARFLRHDALQPGAGLPRAGHLQRRHGARECAAPRARLLRGVAQDPPETSSSRDTPTSRSA